MNQKFAHLLVVSLLPLAVIGCRSSRVAGQPKLHLPSARILTNTPTTSERIKADTNNTNKVTAYVQIASDADVTEEFGTSFSSCFYVGEVVIENKNENPFLAYSSSLEVNVSYYLSEADWSREAKKDAKSGNGQGSNLVSLMRQRFNKEYILSHRRASTYSDILAIFEYQRQSNPKQVTINYIKSAGEIAAGATVFIGGANYPKAVAFATGIVTTELEKRLLWDILLHAKNLEARSLKEVEEIPAFGSVHRLVFFPKRGIPGIVDGHLVYISSFSSRQQPALISGSIIKKERSATTGTLERVSDSEAQPEH